MRAWRACGGGAVSLFAAAGFFTSAPVQVALLAGGAAAVLCAVAGVFTVLRGQAFAGHALADVTSAGGAAALLFGLPPMAGFLALGLAGVLGLEALAPKRSSADRDLAAGILLGAGLGLTALLLYLDVTLKTVSGAAVSVMFGALFAIPAAIAKAAGLACLAALALAAVIYRPLLLASLDLELAAARGVNVRLVGLLYLLLLALSVTLAAMSVGAIFSTALLIGPAGAALRLARRPGQAIALAACFGLIACWGGIFLAYVSYAWTPGHVWPVSFFITGLVLALYALSALVGR